MAVIESMHYLLNLKYVGAFHYIEGTAFMTKRNQQIYTKIVYFQKGI